MTTQQVADRFFELAAKGQFQEIYNELFSEKATSSEAPHVGMPTAVGLAAIHQNDKNWNENILEMHSGFTNKPEVGGSYFSCKMGMDVTQKDNKRVDIQEIALYKVEDGKIVSQQFFY